MGLLIDASVLIGLEHRGVTAGELLAGRPLALSAAGGSGAAVSGVPVFRPRRFEPR